MNLLMLSGDRMVAAGLRGPFHAMLEEFSRHFDRIDVLCPRVPRVVVTTIHERCHFHPSPSRRLAHLGFLLERARALLAERPYGLAVAHGYGMQWNGVAAAILRGTGGPPFVAEVFHVPGHPRASGVGDRVEALLARLFLRTWGRRAVAIRVMHRGEVPSILMRWGVAPERLLVLHAHYLRLDVFRPDADEPKEQDLVFCGRLVANKNLPLFLEVVRRVRGRRPGVRATVIGDGPERERGVALARRLGLQEAVRFDGLVPHDADVALAFRRSRLLVCTSSSEGGPRVTLEAMACGTPVVSTPVGIMPEVLRGGRGGILVEGEADPMADRVASLLADPTRLDAMRTEAVAIARQFDGPRVLGRLAAAYRALGQGADVAAARCAADDHAPEPLAEGAVP